MSAEGCSELVRRGDPDRWRTAMTAPLAKRDGLMALYAFNLEIARAPWVASEPMLAQIRLQWWADAVEEIYAGQAPRRHEVVEPLAEAIRAGALPRHLFDEMIEARGADVSPGADFEVEALRPYLDRTAGHLMELAARHLGAGDAAVSIIRDYAFGAGMAAYLRALPELEARGRAVPRAEVPGLAAEGRAAIGRARAARRGVPAQVLPALLPGWLADVRLERAGRGEDLEVSEFRARLMLLWVSFTGRW